MSFEDSFYIDSIRTVRAPNGINRNEVRSKLIYFSESFANETSARSLAIKLNTASPAEIIAGTDTAKIVTAAGLSAAGIVPGGGGGGGGVETVTASVSTGNASIINSISTSADVVLKTIGRSTQAINIDDGAASIVIGFNDDQVTRLGGVDELRLQSDAGNILIEKAGVGLGNIQLNPVGNLVLNSGHDFTMGGNFTNAGYLSAYGFISTNLDTAIVSDQTITMTPGTNENVNVNPSGSGRFVVNGFTRLNNNVDITNGVIENTSTAGNIILRPDTANAGYIDASNSLIKNVTMPLVDTDAANKEYVDAVAQGFGPKLAVVAKTTDAEAATLLTPGVVFFDGTGVGKTITKLAPFTSLQIDFAPISAGDRILFAGATASEHYGIYTVTSLGVFGVSGWVLTRSPDADNSPTSGEVSVGIYTFVRTGFTHARQGWSLITFLGSIDVNPQTWSQVTQAGSGITTITPNISTQSSALAFTTDGNSPTNVLTINPTLFNAIGTNSTASDIYFGSDTGANRNVRIRTNNSSILYLNDTSSGAILIGSALTTQIQMFAGGSNIIRGGPVQINHSAGGAIDIGTGTNTAAVTIGNNSGGKTISIIGGAGAGNVSINASATSSTTNIGTGTTTGAVVIGGNSNIVSIKNNAVGGGDVEIGGFRSAAPGLVNIGVSPSIANCLVNIGNAAAAAGCNVNICNDATVSGCLVNIARASNGTAVNIATAGTTGAITMGSNTQTGGIFLTSSGFIALNGNVAGTGAVAIGTGASPGGVLIGGTGNNVFIKDTGTNGEINIGRTSGTTTINIGSGTTTGGIAIGNNTTQGIDIRTSSSHTISLNSSTGAIGNVTICNNATAGNVSIGSLGLGNVEIKNNATDGAVTICQNATSSCSINGFGGTGNTIIGGTINNTYIKSHPNVLFNPTAGTVFIANDAGATVVNIGTGTTNGAVTIGNTANTTNINSNIINMPNVIGDTATAGVTLLIGTGGVLGTVVSMRASKYDIVPLSEKYNSSTVIDLLEPQAYKFKSNDAASIGLIAEDVFPVLPEVCPVNAEGAPISVRYDLLTVILLDELKKQKNKIAELERKIATIMQ